MNLKVLFTTLIVALFISVSCEKQTLQTNSKIDDETLALVDDEVLADINSAELFEESADILWGGSYFSRFKSGDKRNYNCADFDIKFEKNKVIITLDFSKDKCGKTGMVIIEYSFSDSSDSFGKATIVYSDFTNNHGVVFNGTKVVEYKNEGYILESEMTVKKKDKEGKKVTFYRNSHRNVKWICEPEDNENMILEVTGETEVTKVAGDIESTYSRKIVSPLLIVKECDLKVQDGVVEVEKQDGTEIIIDYGQMPEEVNCNSEFDCNSTFKITKDGETFTVAFDENGKRVKQDNED